MGKSKDKSITEDADKTLDVSVVNAERPDYDELVSMVNIISKPLASKKMTKRIYKIVKKAAKKKELRRGVKEVAKAIRKKEKGLVIFAGDVSPLDVYSHMPVMCEDNKLPYCFVPARIDLGLASQTKRATCVVMVKKSDDYADAYTELRDAIKELPLPL
ncbi:H/ACA ribonucleoprotein complex subunit 2-like protein [Hydractinia symbiolongicarpus]|uniref:H/ACA ribonucleoprotein complex subunit 2-like protein n=1 Tax=Hydractinia symbiolongicarpus TaxID=13093 RepID=UPI00254B1ABD|nr:H/ACA ribonucleoprotein complex subunit 2-like protein [Hydractinia symbiolongicarpus]